MSQCPPCQSFTPILKELHANLKRAGKPFEVVLCTAEQTEQTFYEEFVDVPWLAIPHRDMRRILLGTYFHVEGERGI